MTTAAEARAKVKTTKEFNADDVTLDEVERIII